MTCHHGIDDPSCSSYRTPEERLDFAKREVDRIIKDYNLTNSPDASEYEIVKIERVGEHLIVMAQYPSCADCSYEGCKVMVFSSVSEVDAIMWREIDPHFGDPDEKRKPTQAPSPVARFPGSDWGFQAAVEFAKDIL